MQKWTCYCAVCNAEVDVKKTSHRFSLGPSNPDDHLFTACPYTEELVFERIPIPCDADTEHFVCLGCLDPQREDEGVCLLCSFLEMKTSNKDPQSVDSLRRDIWVRRHLVKRGIKTLDKSYDFFSEQRKKVWACPLLPEETLSCSYCKKKILNWKERSSCQNEDVDHCDGQVCRPCQLEKATDLCRPCREVELDRESE